MKTAWFIVRENENHEPIRWASAGGWEGSPRRAAVFDNEAAATETLNNWRHVYGRLMDFAHVRHLTIDDDPTVAHVVNTIAVPVEPAMAPADETDTGPDEADQGLGDPKVVVTRARTALAKKTAMRTAFANFLANPDGRDWLRDVLAECHLFTVTRPGASDSALWFAEGERNTGLRLLARATEAAPEAIADIMHGVKR